MLFQFCCSMVKFRVGATMRIISAIDERARWLSLTSTAISIQPIPVPVLVVLPTFLSDIRLSILFLVSISRLEAKSSPGQRITILRVCSSRIVSNSGDMAVLPWGTSSEQPITVKRAIQNMIKANFMFMAWIWVMGFNFNLEINQHKNSLITDKV
jgi:hypothetical protein